MARQLSGRTSPAQGDMALAWAVLGLVGLGGVIWLGLQLAGFFGGHVPVPLGLGRFLSGLAAWPAHAADPRAGFAAPARADLPSGPILYAAVAVVVGLAGAVGIVTLTHLRGKGHVKELAEVMDEVAHTGMAQAKELRQAYPTGPHALALGRAGRTAVFLPAEASLGLVMGSRMGKSSAAVGWVLDHQGPVLATSTKVDLVELTAALRERSSSQPTLVLDPEELAAWPDKLRWSPLSGCTDPRVAQERGSALMAGVRTAGVTNEGFFRGKAASLLRLVLHAAALEGAGVAELRRWVAAPAAARSVPRALRQNTAAPGWAEEWNATLSGDPETLASIAATASLALECLANPALGRLCSPKEEQAFQPEAWLSSGGTLHVVASGTAAASTAPLAAALVDAVMRAVRQVASRKRGRLDPPLRCVLDELPSVAPLPALPSYLADAGGQGMQLICISQAMSQYALAYGRAGRQAIETAFGAVAVGGGIKDPDELERFSRLAGDVEVRRVDHTRGAHESTAYSSHRERRRVVEAADLGRLRRHQVLLVSQAAKSALVELVPWWQRSDAREIQEARDRARLLSGGR